MNKSLSNKKIVSSVFSFISFSVLLFACMLLQNITVVYAEQTKSNREDKGSDLQKDAAPTIIISGPSSVTKGLMKDMREAQILFAYEKQGDEYLKQGEYELAISEYNKLLELANKEYSVLMVMSSHRRLAWTYEAISDYEEVITHVQFLVEHTQSEIARRDYLKWLDVLNFASQGQFDKAVQYYQELLDMVEDWEKPSTQKRLDAMRDKLRKSKVNKFQIDKYSSPENTTK